MTAQESSFLLTTEMGAWLSRLELGYELVTSDPHAHDALYRITTRRDGRIPVPGEILFIGTEDRCSDFLKGYLQGTRKRLAEDGK